VTPLIDHNFVKFGNLTDFLCVCKLWFSHRSQ